jgi:NAD(P)-dependent dehydrogenase (short-subunit alcohol dehydrogenase family)
MTDDTGSRPAEQPPATPSGVDLSGTVALVTGATAGLGWRFSQTLAAAGSHVVATGRRLERLQALASTIQDQGGACTPVRLDVTDADQIDQVVSSVGQEHGLISILVNNAGIPDAQRAHRMSTEFVDTVLATNLRGPYLLACAVARPLIAANRPGRIINISSSGAFSYDGNGAALYSITKAAINRMTEALAVEWSRFYINVNAIAPGAFNSEMMDGMIGRIGDFTHTLPRKRIGQPSQLDSTLLYLADPASECVTGTIIRVDDGQGTR